MSLRASIPSSLMFTWESQARQYPELLPPGTHRISEHVGQYPVECLVHYNELGELVGILNYYPQSIPPYEVEGNINIWIRKDFKRQGIATALLMELLQLGWYIRPMHKQLLTVEGVEFFTRMIERGVLSPEHMGEASA